MVAVGYRFAEIYGRLTEARVLGLMAREEYEKLYGIARGVGAYRAGALIVELGTYEGFSAIVISYGLRSHGPEKCRGTRIVSVDNYAKSGRTSPLGNVRTFGCHEIVELVESDTAASAALFEDQSVDLLFFDAGKEYHDVLGTLEAFFPKVATSGQQCRGIICGHDYTARTADGIKVVRAVEDWKAAHAHRLFGWGLHESFWWTIKD